MSDTVWIALIVGVVLVVALLLMRTVRAEGRGFSLFADRGKGGQSISARGSSKVERARQQSHGSTDDQSIAASGKSQIYDADQHADDARKTKPEAGGDDEADRRQ